MLEWIVEHGLMILVVVVLAGFGTLVWLIDPDAPGWDLRIPDEIVEWDGSGEGPRGQN